MRSLALGGLIFTAVLPLGAPAAQAAPWCSTYGGMSCGYYTFEQCIAATRGVGGSCVRNPQEAPAERAAPQSRRDAKPKRERDKKPAAVAPRETAAPPKPPALPPAPVAEPAPPPPAHQAVKSFAEARGLILSGKYETGIAAMIALGQDDRPDVAVSIGYANYRLGHLDEAKRWYDKALVADPNHVATLANYGMLRAEQGDVEKARDDLQKVKTLCGTGCREYKELADAIAARANRP